MPLIKRLSHITFLSNTKRHTEVYFSKQKLTTELLSFMLTKNEKKHYQLAGLIQTSHQSSSFDQHLELSPAFLLREKDRDARHLHPRMGTKDRRIISKQMRDKRKISLFPTKILPEDLPLLCFPTKAGHCSLTRSTALQGLCRLPSTLTMCLADQPEAEVSQEQTTFT